MNGRLPETGIPLVDALLALMVESGYLVAFLATVFENIFVVGSLTPGDSFVVAAAFVAEQGMLKVGWVWLATFMGTLTGSNISFIIGRRTGLDGVRGIAERASRTRLGRMMRIDATGADDVEALFELYGARTIFVSRFAMGIKNFVPAIAGASGMSVVRFELLTLAGVLIHTTLMVLLGWILGENLSLAIQVATWIGWFGLAIVALLAAGLYFSRNRIRRRWAIRREHRARAAGTNGDDAQADETRGTHESDE